jgi:4-oxalocrotonate tautomerase
MPLVRISLREGKTEEYKKALTDGVHRALIEAMDAPVQDRFQVITDGQYRHGADYSVDRTQAGTEAQAV